jgi:sugar phosphate isomerase/epimerase
VCPLAAAQESQPAAKATHLTNPLAIRIMNYGKYQQTAWTHLPSIDMHYLFLSAPMPDQVTLVTKLLAEHHLRPLVFRGYTDPGHATGVGSCFYQDYERKADLGPASSIDQLAARLAVCKQMGVKYLFLSQHHTGLTKEETYERLHRLGEIAKKHGATIVLETHQDLGNNAAVHLETMKRVNHPNVRVNFDTGNITFYNKNTDAVTELKKIIDYVATVELKDHNGQYRVFNFPALGKGVVDFPAVLKVLEEHHFQGPIVLEVEGVTLNGVPMTEDQTKQFIAESVRYIQSLGDFQ